MLALARLLQAPVTSHRSGRGIVSDESPYGMRSVAAYDYWKEADLLIGIGSRLELQYFRWRCLPPGLKSGAHRYRPHRDGALETRCGSRHRCHARHARVDRGARAAGGAARLARGGIPGAQSTRRGARPRRSTSDELPRCDSPRLAAQRLSSSRRSAQAGFAASFGFPVHAPRRYVTCGYQDNLGFGFNTALGVKVAHPAKPWSRYCGDGGFLFGCQELATAVRYAINLVSDHLQ